jgi:hypothetical protein
MNPNGNRLGGALELDERIQCVDLIDGAAVSCSHGIYFDDI